MEAVLEQEKQIKNNGQKQIVIFQLGEEEYAVDIIQSKEIIKVSKITPVPNTPSYVRGVINLRGQIVPVVDLRRRFNIPGVSNKERIITVEVRDTLIGLVVDGVNEVFWFDMKDLEPAPQVEGSIKQEFIQGVARKEDRLLVIVDLERLLFENKDEE